jgi:hypothetical protein
VVGGWIGSFTGGCLGGEVGRAELSVVGFVAGNDSGGVIGCIETKSKGDLTGSKTGRGTGGNVGNKVLGVIIVGVTTGFVIGPLVGAWPAGVDSGDISGADVFGLPGAGRWVGAVNGAGVVSVVGVTNRIGAPVRVVLVGIVIGANVGDFPWMGGCVVISTGSTVKKGMGTAVLASVGAGPWIGDFVSKPEGDGGVIIDTGTAFCVSGIILNIGLKEGTSSDLGVVGIK